MKNANSLRKLVNTGLVFAVLSLSLAGCATKQTSSQGDKKSDEAALRKAERMFNSHERSALRER